MVGEVGGELGRVRALADRDEDRVVAGDRARDVGQAGVVDRVGERGGEAARGVDHEQLAGRDHRAGPVAQRGGELLEPAQVGGARKRVDEPAVAVSHLHEPELGDVARDGRLHGVDPLAAERLGELGLRREVALLDQARIAPWRSSFVVIPSPESGLTQEVDRQVGLVLGDRQRRRDPQRGLAGGADEQVVLERRERDRPGRPVELDREQEPGAARLGERAAKRAPISRTCASRSSSIASTTAQAAAHDTGLPPKVEAWSPGTKPVGAASETSSAPIGRPFASPFASVTASGRTPCAARRRTRRSGRRRSAPRRRRASRRARRRAPRASASVSVVSGRTPPSPWTGSRKIAAVSGPDGAGERLGRREADARDERLERRPLRRLAGDRERAHRAPVERAFERDELGLPGRLARPLDRRLDRLGARVAEERVRAAEPVGEQPGELLHRLGRVEVRDVPEPLELLLRGLERRRVAVAEADDGDPGDEVEVALAVVGDQPAALAVDERDREAGVGREQRRAGEDGHAAGHRSVSADRRRRRRRGRR